MNLQSHDRIVALIKEWVLSQNGGPPMAPHHLAELKEWMEERPENEHFIDLISQPGQFQQDLESMERFDSLTDEALQRFQKRRTALRRPFRVYLPWMAAASIAGVVLALTLYYKKPSPSMFKVTPPITALDKDPGKDRATLTLGDGSKIVLDEADRPAIPNQGGSTVSRIEPGTLSYGSHSSKAVVYNTVSTPKGGQFKVLLPDGTQVWLNAASSITFPSAFHGASRSVGLSGEAYFDVAKDRDHPFLISAAKDTVEVIGTTLNLSFYPEESAHVVTLLTGAVRVSNSTGKQLLQPGQAAMNAGAGNWQVSNVDTEQVVAWKTGIFNFDHLDLRTALRQVARWYDIEVIYEGPIPDKSIFASIPRNTKLSTIIKLLEELNLKCRLQGNALYISS